MPPEPTAERHLTDREVRRVARQEWPAIIGPGDALEPRQVVRTSAHGATTPSFAGTGLL